jgi:lysophospholipase L1-like esterase
MTDQSSQAQATLKLSASKRLLFSSLLIIVPLIFLEIGFRIYDARQARPAVMASAQKDESFWKPFHSIHEAKPNSKVLYGLKPNAKASFQLNRPEPVEYTINSAGFREKEYSLEKPADVTRIAVLGDSITFGFEVPVQYTYAKVMEDLLNKNGTGKYEVLNFGVGGYSTYNELEQLQETVLAYHPNIVVLGFCMNDVASPYAEFTPHTSSQLNIPDDAIPNPAMKIHSATLFSKAGAALFRYSYMARYLQSWYARKIKKDKAKVNANFELYNLDCLEALSDPYSIEWQWLGKKLLKMNAVCKANNINLLVAIFPLYYQLDQRYAYADSRRTLMQFCWQNEIPAVDIYDVFEEYSLDTRQVIYVDQLHPNEIGHNLAGQIITGGVEKIIKTAALEKSIKGH